ncbi:MAG: prepilin-type N-terminal cleavage/methylation domain-containing protein [Myxococcota bacterium]
MFESREASAPGARSARPEERRPSSIRRSLSSRAGLTLIELLIALAIMGVLASIATPRMTNFLLRAKRSEAYMALSGVHTAQTAYLAEVGQYGNTFAAIGFELEGGVTISPTQIDGNEYRFELQTFDFNGIPDGNFSVTATADLVPGDAVLDILMIENNIIVKE